MDRQPIEVAAIGPTDAVLLYNAAGFVTFVAPTPAEADKIVFMLFGDGCKVILVDEVLYAAMAETIQKYQQKPFPILMAVPMSVASRGIGLKKIQDNVEKAIGINIF